MIRNVLMASAMLFGLSGAAMADSWNPPLPSGAHSEAVSQGVPHVLGYRDGQPVIRYSGTPRGNLSAGIPVVVGNQDGQPVIHYEPAPGAVAAGIQ
ncbi:hypothetical protein ACFOD4_02610 [Pseudoroseomonas globiformis]|uniref:Uncharacterized protein n=1 Tax=Teichococcus globiformis TaxID=2307229 RepID=A0ABV7FYT3_9PROT